MSVDQSKLSPQAQELIRLAGAGERNTTPDVQSILADRPDLMVGLNEYMTWHRDHWAAVSQKSVTSTVAHPLAGISQHLGGQTKG